MNVSDLIKELQELMRLEGDLPVAVEDELGNLSSPVAMYVYRVQRDGSAEPYIEIS